MFIIADFNLVEIFQKNRLFKNFDTYFLLLKALNLYFSMFSLDIFQLYASLLAVN